MKTKAISLTLATLMSVQTVAHANTDRTEGIGQQAVLTAQESIAAIQAQMVTLDQSLERAAKAVENRDSKGGITNSIAIGAAVVGVGLATSAYFTVRKGGEGSGLGGLLAGAMAVGATVVSAVTGLTSQGLKTSVDTKELEAQLDASQKSIEAAIAQTTDKVTAVSLTQLNLTLKNTQLALTAYQTDKSDESKVRLSAQGAQIAGGAISLLSLRFRIPAGFLLGPALMSAGSLTAIIAGMDSEDAETVLKEIQQTRDSLKIAQAALK